MDLDQVSTSAFEIAKEFDDLFQLTADTGPKMENGSKMDSLKDVYVAMNNTMVSWGNSLVKQANFMQENLVYFLKYQAKQIPSFQEVFPQIFDFFHFFFPHFFSNFLRIKADFFDFFTNKS